MAEQRNAEFDLDEDAFELRGVHDVLHPPAWDFKNAIVARVEAAHKIVS